MKPVNARACDFLKALVFDFAKIDPETYPFLADEMNFPLSEHASFVTKRIENLSLDATNYPELGIIFSLSKDRNKHFLPAFAFHRFSKS